MKTGLIFIDHIPTPWAAHCGYGKKSWDKRYAQKQEYKRQIKEQWGEKQLITSAVILDIYYVLPIPKSTSKVRREAMIKGEIDHLVPPDVTNLNKLTEDCLQGIVMGNDSAVIDVRGRKRHGPRPCIQIWVHYNLRE